MYQLGLNPQSFQRDKRCLTDFRWRYGVEAAPASLYNNGRPQSNCAGREEQHVRENVEIPAAARYEGVADGVIQWSVPTLDRDTLLGPFTYALPTRRPLTAGLTVRAFSSADLTDWREVTAETAGAAVPKQLGFGATGCTTMPFGFTTCSSNAFGFGGGFGGGFGAFGVNQNDRLQSSITGTALSQQFGQPFRPAQISDGASNIIAILIGIR